jgi:hypothetical protein
MFYRLRLPCTIKQIFGMKKREMRIFFYGKVLRQKGSAATSNIFF